MTLVWDPVLQARLHLIKDLPAPALQPPTPEVAAAMAAWDAPPEGYVVPQVDARDLAIPGPRGPVDARVYFPPTGNSDRGFVWIHGGAFMFGDLDMAEADVVSRELCVRGDMVVVSLDYRKTIDGAHYPVGQDDVFAAWNWIVRESGFTTGPWAIGGASAGASLAASLVQRARDYNCALPDRVNLIYPAGHRVMPDGGAAFDAIMAQVPARLTFPPETIAIINANYIGQQPGDLTYAWPGDGNLAGFPPTLVVNAEFDSLRPSGEHLAAGIAAAGATVECLTEVGVPHGHMNIPGLPTQLRTIDRMVAFTRG